MEDNLNTNITEYKGLLPIFPLPNVVLFPNTFLPLHVFEERYKNLSSDVLSGDSYMGIVLLKQGHEKCLDGKPKIYQIGCLARVINSNKLKDGRYDLILYGIKRIKLDEVETSKCYRVANIQILEEQQMKFDSNSKGTKFLITTCKLLLSKLMNTQQLKDTRINDLSPSLLVDFVCAYMNMDVLAKQWVLEESDVERRLERLMSILKLSDKEMEASVRLN